MSRPEIVTRTLVLAAAAAIVVGLYSLVPHIRAERFTPVVLDSPSDAASYTVVVAVSGDAPHPGLYSLDPSTSLSELMTLAGINHGGAAYTLSVAINPTSTTSERQQVDLNHADAWLLDALPGIGPDRAKAIVDYRENYGPFYCTDELTLVPGIGNATYEALKHLVTVTP